MDPPTPKTRGSLLKTQRQIITEDLIRLFPRASKSFMEANPNLEHKNAVQGNVERKKAKHDTINHRKIQDSKPEHHETPALDSADEGKAKGSGRVIVRFIGYRVRPLDPDNFAGGCKDLLDALRHSSLIHGDEWWRIDFQTRQEKVGTYAEEKTVIEVETPPKI